MYRVEISGANSMITHKGIKVRTPVKLFLEDNELPLMELQVRSSKVLKMKAHKIENKKTVEVKAKAKAKPVEVPKVVEPEKKS